MFAISIRILIEETSQKAPLVLFMALFKLPFLSQAFHLDITYGCSTQQFSNYPGIPTEAMSVFTIFSQVSSHFRLLLKYWSSDFFFPQAKKLLINIYAKTKDYLFMFILINVTFLLFCIIFRNFRLSEAGIIVNLEVLFCWCILVCDDQILGLSKNSKRTEFP